MTQGCSAKGQSEAGTQGGLPHRTPGLDLPGAEVADPGPEHCRQGIWAEVQLRPGPRTPALSPAVAGAWGRFKLLLEGTLAPDLATGPGPRCFQMPTVSQVEKAEGLLVNSSKEASVLALLPQTYTLLASETPYNPHPWPQAHFPPTDPHPRPPAHRRHTTLVLHPPSPPPRAHLPFVLQQAEQCCRLCAEPGCPALRRGVPRVAMGTAGLCDVPPPGGWGRGGRRAQGVGVGRPQPEGLRAGRAGLAPRPRTRLKEPTSLSPRARPQVSAQTVQRLRSLPWERHGLSPGPGCLFKPKDATCLHPLAGQWWGPFQDRVSVPELPSPQGTPTTPGNLTLGRRLCRAKRPSDVLWVQAWEGVRGRPGR